MCRVSDKLKLCTCKTEDVYKLKHYWIFYRFIEGQKRIVIGSVNPPYRLDLFLDMINRQSLMRILNEESPFDVNLSPAANDLLSLHFTCGENDKLVYGFKFEDNEWCDEPYDPLMWMWHHTEEIGGKISNALNRQPVISQ